MISHRTLFPENDDLLLWRGPALKEKLFSSSYLIYLGEQCFCVCNKVLLDGLASQHGAEK